MTDQQRFRHYCRDLRDQYRALIRDVPGDRDHRRIFAPIACRPEYRAYISRMERRIDRILYEVREGKR